MTTMTRLRNPHDDGTPEHQLWEDAHPSHCPDWCDGREDRHDVWWQEIVNGSAEHTWVGRELMARETRERPHVLELQVRVEQSPNRWPLVKLFGRMGDERGDFHMTSGEARTLAAMLLQAADVIDLR